MRFIALTITILVLTGSFFCAYADATPEYKGTLKFVVQDLPVFSQYPAEAPASRKAKNIDWDSHPASREFKTVLSEGLQEGANFAGKYAVIVNGCGSGCQVNWVVDVETGKILDRLETTHGVMFQKDSSLLIADMPWAPEVLDKEWAIEAGVITGGPIKFYRVSKGKLALIGKLDYPGIEK